MRVGKMILVLTLVAGLIVMFMPGFSYADPTSDLILQLLVKKGVVTQTEVDELKAQIKEVKVPAIAAEEFGKHAEAAKWAEKVKVKGDVRLRHEYEKRGTGSYVSRERIRARAGIEAKLTDTVKAALLLVTGGTGVGTSRSTNQTLLQAFGTKPFDIDQAYIEWKPNKNLTFTGGKYKNPLYVPGDLLWDSDINFEGASTNIKYPLEKEFDIPLDLMLNGGLFPLDDLGVDAKNPFLAAIQGGVGSSIGDDIDWKFFTGYLDFTHIKNSASTSLTPTTGLAGTNGGYRYDYNVVEASGDVTLHYFEKEFQEPFNKPLKFFGDYAANLADNDRANAWEIGVKYGKKLEKFGDWKALYNFRFLSNNAFPDDFPDADAFSGGTNGYGHEVIFSYGLTKNIWLEFDYYINRNKSLINTSDRDKWSHLLQFDLNAKF